MPYFRVLAQAELGTPAPTTRAMSIVYGPLGTAIEQVHVGDANAEQALTGANESMSSLLSSSPLLNPILFPRISNHQYHRTSQFICDSIRDFC